MNRRKLIDEAIEKFPGKKDEILRMGISDLKKVLKVSEKKQRSAERAIVPKSDDENYDDDDDTRTVINMSHLDRKSLFEQKQSRLDQLEKIVEHYKNLIENNSKILSENRKFLSSDDIHICQELAISNYQKMLNMALNERSEIKTELANTARLTRETFENLMKNVIDPNGKLIAYLQKRIEKIDQLIGK